VSLYQVLFVSTRASLLGDSLVSLYQVLFVSTRASLLGDSLVSKLMNLSGLILL
jgi:hypothetical protein